MNRRYFLGSLGAVLGIAAAPKLATAVTTPYPKSARELLAAGFQVEAVIVSLVYADFYLIGLPLNRADLGCTYQTRDIPPAERLATVRAGNVTVSSGERGVWLDCDDASFYDVSGDGAAGLMVALRFTNGEEPIVGFLTDSNHFSGCPVIPNGGNVHVNMPIEGLLRIA